MNESTNPKPILQGEITWRDNALTKRVDELEKKVQQLQNELESLKRSSELA